MVKMILNSAKMIPFIKCSKGLYLSIAIAKLACKYKCAVFGLANSQDELFDSKNDVLIAYHKVDKMVKNFNIIPQIANLFLWSANLNGSLSLRNNVTENESKKKEILLLCGNSYRTIINIRVKIKIKSESLIELSTPSQSRLVTIALSSMASIDHEIEIIQTSETENTLIEFNGVQSQYFVLLNIDSVLQFYIEESNFTPIIMIFIAFVDEKPLWLSSYFFVSIGSDANIIIGNLEKRKLGNIHYSAHNGIIIATKFIENKNILVTSGIDNSLRMCGEWRFKLRSGHSFYPTKSLGK